MNLENLSSSLYKENIQILFSFGNGNMVGVDTSSSAPVFSSNLGNSWSVINSNLHSAVYVGTNNTDFILITAGDRSRTGISFLFRITQDGNCAIVSGTPNYARNGVLHGNYIILGSYIPSSQSREGEGLAIYSYNEGNNSITLVQTLEGPNTKGRFWNFICEVSLGFLETGYCFYKGAYYGESSSIYIIKMRTSGYNGMTKHPFPAGNWDFRDVQWGGYYSLTLYFMSRHYIYKISPRAEDGVSLTIEKSTNENLSGFMVSKFFNGFIYWQSGDSTSEAYSYSIGEGHEKIASYDWPEPINFGECHLGNSNYVICDLATGKVYFSNKDSSQRYIYKINNNIKHTVIQNSIPGVDEIIYALKTNIIQNSSIHIKTSSGIKTLKKWTPPVNSGTSNLICRGVNGTDEYLVYFNRNLKNNGTLGFSPDDNPNNINYIY